MLVENDFLSAYTFRTAVLFRALGDLSFVSLGQFFSCVHYYLCSWALDLKTWCKSFIPGRAPGLFQGSFAYDRQCRMPYSESRNFCFNSQLHFRTLLEHCCVMSGCPIRVDVTLLSRSQ